MTLSAVRFAFVSRATQQLLLPPAVAEILIIAAPTAAAWKPINNQEITFAAWGRVCQMFPDAIRLRAIELPTERLSY